MKEVRLEIRLIKNEKSALVKAARDTGMSVSDYVRYRLFENNPDINDLDYLYEIPKQGKHNYLSMGITLDTYYLLCKLVIEQKGVEEANHLINECRELAKSKTRQYGYLKMEVKDE